MIPLHVRIYSGNLSCDYLLALKTGWFRETHTENIRNLPASPRKERDFIIMTANNSKSGPACIKLYTVNLNHSCIFLHMNNLYVSYKLIFFFVVVQ